MLRGIHRAQSGHSAQAYSAYSVVKQCCQMVQYFRNFTCSCSVVQLQAYGPHVACRQNFQDLIAFTVLTILCVLQ